MKRLLLAVIVVSLLAGPAAAAPMRLDPIEKKRMIGEREQAAARKRAEAIRLLEELLAMRPEGETASDALYKLAELYWEDSRQRFAAAMQAWEKRGDKSPPPRLDVARSEKLYREIVEKYPKSRRIDTVLYLLGFGAHEANRGDEAVTWLNRLIAEQPASPLVPDAWMMLGEHYFVADFAKARSAYGKVLEHKDSPVYDLALFKSAWCDWKLGDTKRAAERFKEVLDLATVAEKSGSAEQKKRSVQLRDEALQYLTLLFTEDENITAKDAYDFLSSIGGERYSREVLGRLADLFSAQGRHDRAVQAWKHLISLDPNHRDVPKHYLRVMDAYMSMDAADEAMATAKEVMALKVKPPVRAEIEEAVAVLAQRLHGAAQRDEEQRKKPDLAAYKRAAELYAAWLKQFGDRPRAGELRFLRAEILYFKLGALEEAGDEYMVVGQSKGPHTKDALLKAMSAYEKLRPKDTGGKRKLTAADRKFAAAVNAFAKEFPADAEVVGVIYKNGQMFFDYGDYDEAVKRFGLIVTKYPDDPNAGAAGDRILEALAKGEDYQNIEEWAKKLKGARAFQTPAEQTRLDEIIVQAIVKIAEKHIEDSKLDLAAATYMRVAKEYPADKRAPSSLVSAGVTFEAAQQPLRAAEVYLQAVERYPQASGAAQAAFSAGRAYEQMAYFDKAADAYGIVAYRYATDAKASDALFNLAVLSEALGATQQAIKADLEYARRYPKQKDLEAVSFRVGAAYAGASDAGKAADAWAAYVRKFSSSPRVVEAEARIGKAWLAAGQSRRAEESLARALARWKGLPRAAQKEAARWAAEARYLQGEVVFADYEAIALDVKPAALKGALEKKKALLAKAQGVYTDVVSYGDPSSATAALQRIGQIYEQFADQLRKLPAPPGLSEEEQQVYREEVDRFVIDMEDKAAGIYEVGYKKALDLKVYGESTRRLREGLGRLAENKFPPEREARARVRVGDRAPEPEIVKDLGEE